MHESGDGSGSDFDLDGSSLGPMIVGSVINRAIARAEAAEHDVTDAHQSTGEVIATSTIHPTKNYRRNKKEPDRWPGSSL
jgi:hypothetical protein